MFFADKIKNVKETERVLEIGPGAYPHPRSDVFLEKIFDSKDAFVQSGYANPAELKKEVVYYKGDRFPFEDKSFDYVICSHVVEHIPVNELPLFISEMERVAKKGYIEFPTVFYELVNYEPVHLWLMNFRDGKMLFLDKTIFVSSNIHKIIKTMFYCKDKYMRNVLGLYKELFFFGFEWENKIPYEIVKEYDVLVDESDVEKWAIYFNEKKAPVVPINKSALPIRVYKRIKRLFI